MKADNTNQVSSRLDKVRPFYVMDLLARARQLEEAGKSVIHLEVGEPDFATPQPIVDAGIEALKRLQTHYTPAMGLTRLREAVAGYYLDRFGIGIDPQRVVITPGASGALQLALSVLADTDDSVMLTDPGYPCNRNMVHLLGAETVNVPVSAETGFQLTADLAARYWQGNTVAAMIASPSNPTGTTISGQELAGIADTVRQSGGRLIVDEIYQGITYTEQDMTALACSNELFVINSFSKYFGMTGWRIGWMVVPEQYIEAVDRVAQNIFLAAPTVAQHAALVALDRQIRQELDSRVEQFRQRRDYLLPRLRKLGFGVPVEPTGAFYIYADCSAFTQDTFGWTANLLEQTGVAITPGIDFGEHLAAIHVRFAYTREIDQLEEAVNRIAQYLNQGH